MGGACQCSRQCPLPMFSFWLIISYKWWVPVPVSTVHLARLADRLAAANAVLNTTNSQHATPMLLKKALTLLEVAGDAHAEMGR